MHFLPALQYAQKCAHCLALGFLCVRVRCGVIPRDHIGQLLYALGQIGMHVHGNSNRNSFAQQLTDSGQKMEFAGSDVLHRHSPVKREIDPVQRAVFCCKPVQDPVFKFHKRRFFHHARRPFLRIERGNYLRPCRLQNLHARQGREHGLSLKQFKVLKAGLLPAESIGLMIQMRHSYTHDAFSSTLSFPHALPRSQRRSQCRSVQARAPRGIRSTGPVRSIPSASDTNRALSGTFPSRASGSSSTVSSSP